MRSFNYHFMRKMRTGGLWSRQGKNYERRSQTSLPTRMVVGPKFSRCTICYQLPVLSVDGDARLLSLMQKLTTNHSVRLVVLQILFNGKDEFFHIKWHCTSLGSVITDMKSWYRLQRQRTHGWVEGKGWRQMTAEHSTWQPAQLNSTSSYSLSCNRFS